METQRILLVLGSAFTVDIQFRVCGVTERPPKHTKATKTLTAFFVRWLVLIRGD